ncbi:MAG: hypothetical protein ACFE0O_14215 [Opitutales bacterium]
MQLLTRIQRVSEHPTYENQEIFRSLSDGLFEFKRPGLRLYAFYQTLDGTESLIICTSGGKKQGKKAQQADINRARARMRTLLNALRADQLIHLTLPEDHAD